MFADEISEHTNQIEMALPLIVESAKRGDAMIEWLCKELAMTKRCKDHSRLVERCSQGVGCTRCWRNAAWRVATGQTDGLVDES